MGIFKNFFKKQAEQDAREIFQIREHNGEIWLTHCGSLVCPCSMLNVEPVEALREMRGLYVQNFSEK